jgi:hypothetical protein
MDDDSPAPDGAWRQAETWARRLGERPLRDGEFQAFRAWLHEPGNRTAWQALAAAPPRPERFVVRPQPAGFRVVDIWTGETAVIAMTPQDGLSEEDARHVARLLNARAEGPGLQ